MMTTFVLLLIFPCLITADTPCNDGELSCPEGKACCTVNGTSACCDTEELEAQLPQRSALLITPTNITVQNSFGDCSSWCQGTCCNGWCCPAQMATCCPGNTCCPFLSTCCKGFCCASPAATCCSGNKCCEVGATCCGTGCCPMMSKCCGSWCCKSSQRCGLYYRTCYNAATGLYPTRLVTLVAVWVAAYVLTKM